MEKILPLLRVAFLLSFLFIMGPGLVAQASENDITLSALAGAQGQFKDLSETLGLSINYNPLAPAAPLGILGFDIGVEVSAVDVDEEAAFLKNAFSADNSPPSVLLFPKLHVQKGLPFRIDVGAIYSKLPSSNIGLIGAEVKWAALPGSVATPAIALRGTYSRLLGIGELDLDTYGIDLSASKGFGFVTPYLGIGQVWIDSRPNIAGLSDESLSRTKGFVGLKAKMLLLSLVGEVQVSEILSYSLRANLSF